MKIVQAIITILPIIASVNAESYNNLRRKLQPDDDGDVDTITFDDPTHHQKRVDYCLTFEEDCGKPAADRYCQEKGFIEAVDYLKKNSYDAETLTMEGHSTCSPENHPCSTFESITCRVKTQTYYDPKEHKRALDGCLEWEDGCGEEAANAFCVDQGYAKSIDFIEVEEEEEETMTIGDHAVCDPDWHDCSTFLYITCVASTE